ncbi:hypothetical protein GCM10010421_24770 [Streptomyces glaucus]|uniref:Secreted protein n=1 Tax=Streptomyces glaucus TaxID=284029 RepID=A0ABN3JP82_9ACTN
MGAADGAVAGLGAGAGLAGSGRVRAGVGVPRGPAGRYATLLSAPARAGADGTAGAVLPQAPEGRCGSALRSGIHECDNLRAGRFRGVVLAEGFESIAETLRRAIILVLSAR